MTSSEKCLTILDILNRFLNREIDSSLALKSWPNMVAKDERILKELWHQLYHYDVDIDIREKDIEYDNNLRSGILEQAEQLRKLMAE